MKDALCLPPSLRKLQLDLRARPLLRAATIAGNKSATPRNKHAFFVSRKIRRASRGRKEIFRRGCFHPPGRGMKMEKERTGGWNERARGTLLSASRAFVSTLISDPLLPSNRCTGSIRSSHDRSRERCRRHVINSCLFSFPFNHERVAVSPRRRAFDRARRFSARIPRRARREIIFLRNNST